jgi:predicted nucleotidyltransferase
MPYGLTDKEIQEIQKIVALNNRVTEVILFGSRAQGIFKAGSDVDLAIKGDTLALPDLLQINGLLEETFLPYTFDCVLFSHLKDAAIKDHIKRVGIPIYKQPHDSDRHI